MDPVPFVDVGTSAESKPRDSKASTLFKIALIDYNDPVVGFANRDQTGGFGSGMHASGLVGKVVSRLKKTGLRIPVLNLGYLSAIGRKAGHEVSFYTGMPQGEDLVIISSSMLHSSYEIELARNIKNQFPNSKVGFIGPFSAEKPELFQGVSDFIIDGEPEEVFEMACYGEIDLKGVVKSPNVSDLNALPFPSWDGFDLESYGYDPVLTRKPFLTIQASRGCPFACEFCPYLVMQDIPLRRRDNENIVAEMRHLVDTYGIKSLLFRDITWSMNKKLTKDLCKLIAKQGFDLDIGIETRLDTLDSELIGLMVEAGVKVVNLGIESPDDLIVTSSGRKPIKEDKIKRGLKELEDQGIRIQAFYILGLIDDTEMSMLKTIEYSKELNTYTAQFCVLTPFPGTKTFNDLQDRILTTDYSKYTEYDPVVRIDGASPEKIRELTDVAFNSYYLRPKWLLKHGWTAAKGLFRPLLKS
jgi:radical SAM superfamily enzyme YgiQ (UPF0313 family)